MQFKELTQKEISDFLINDPNLAYMGLPDTDLAHMYEHKEYVLHPGSFYIGIEKEDTLIGILKWEYFSDVAITVHPYISSKYQSKGLAKEMAIFVKEHLMKNTEVKKVLAFIMEPCEPAIRAVQACGFQKEGFISKCTKWRNELVGMYIFGTEV